MTDEQWNRLLDVLQGKPSQPTAAFIIDSPWLPSWYGVTVLDYFSDDEVWYQANLKAAAEFPEVIFLPGFWAEFGMCTEPSAFGARCAFPRNEFPHAHPVIRSTAELDRLPQPNPETDGLLPFVINRLRRAQPRMEKAGHRIRFAVARGPLNVASYLLGMTELLTAVIMDPEGVHALLRRITDFLHQWLELQRKSFPSIDGILLLDDIIGFLGEDQFIDLALPYFKELYDQPAAVKFLHNDAPCRVSAPHLADMGVNLFNMGIDVELAELRSLVGEQVTLMGNIPPRDVLAAASPAEVRAAVHKLQRSLTDPRRILFSCGGGMPPGVSSENIRAFVGALTNNPEV